MPHRPPHQPIDHRSWTGLPGHRRRPVPPGPSVAPCKTAGAVSGKPHRCAQSKSRVQRERIHVRVGGGHTYRGCTMSRPHPRRSDPPEINSASFLATWAGAARRTPRAARLMRRRLHRRKSGASCPPREPRRSLFGLLKMWIPWRRLETGRAPSCARQHRANAGGVTATRRKHGHGRAR